MAKIMLVEDDTNLSEIYQARLAAEGYGIVSAHDGEEALALAAKEKPDLIISDVMMPKISGFEMLDILRNTDGLKATKVIMLTALGQAEDKTRAEGLGADRYLVKSQVTLEDIVKAAQELLEGATQTPATVAAPTATAVSAPAPTPNPAPPMPVAIAAPPPTPTPTIPVATPPPVAPVATSILAPVTQPSVPAAPTPPVDPLPTVTMPTGQAATAPTPAALPITQPQPVVAPLPIDPASTTQPPDAPLVEPADPNAVADNKLVTDAVEDLLEGVANKSAAIPEAQTVSTVASVSSETSVPKAVPAAEPAQTTDVAANRNIEPSKNGGASANDNVAIAHKKIIAPIDDPTLKKPDLNSLLAAEENKNPSTINQPIITGDAAGQASAKLATPAPHQPGHVIAPDGVAATGPNPGNGIDPSSIAL